MTNKETLVDTPLPSKNNGHAGHMLINCELEDMGQRIKSRIMLHGDQIAGAMEEGVERAIQETDFVELFAKKAKEEIQKRINDEVNMFFSTYNKGPGGMMIRRVVVESLEHLVGAMRAEYEADAKDSPPS